MTDTDGPVLSMPKVSNEDAYNAGYDAGFNEPTTKNTHFSYFMSEETMKEWERGQKDGAEKRRQDK